MCVVVCGSHDHIGEDVGQLMVAMHGVMKQVLDHIPEKHRKQWQTELLVDASFYTRERRES